MGGAGHDETTQGIVEGFKGSRFKDNNRCGRVREQQG